MTIQILAPTRLTAAHPAEPTHVVTSLRQHRAHSLP